MARPGRFNRAAPARQRVDAAGFKGRPAAFLSGDQPPRLYKQDGVQSCVGFCVATLLCNTPLCRSL